MTERKMVTSWQGFGGFSEIMRWMIAGQYEPEEVSTVRFVTVVMIEIDWKNAWLDTFCCKTSLTRASHQQLKEKASGFYQKHHEVRY